MSFAPDEFWAREYFYAVERAKEAEEERAALREKVLDLKFRGEIQLGPYSLKMEDRQNYSVINVGSLLEDLTAKLGAQAAWDLLECHIKRSSTTVVVTIKKIES